MTVESYPGVAGDLLQGVNVIKLFFTVLYNKTFTAVNYQYSKLARVFVPGMAFQSGVMPASKARACLSEATSTRGQAPGLTHKHYTLGWKEKPRKNTLTYY